MTITEGGERKINPAYEERVTTDQLLLGWLFNTMTVEIASQLLGCSTSQQLWKLAKDLAGAHTRSRVY